jgi:hypothetical protein
METEYSSESLVQNLKTTRISNPEDHYFACVRIATMKMETISSFETFVTTYKTTRYHNPQQTLT